MTILVLMMASPMCMSFVIFCNSLRIVKMPKLTCQPPHHPAAHSDPFSALSRQSVKRTWAMYVGVGDFETQVMDIVMYQQVPPLSLSLILSFCLSFPIPHHSISLSFAGLCHSLH
jgi:hypothetical protein